MQYHKDDYESGSVYRFARILPQKSDKAKAVTISRKQGLAEYIYNNNDDHDDK